MKQVYRLLPCIMIAASLIPSHAQEGRNKVPYFTATGTGRTTGHIADLKVKNTEDTPINILPQTVYIPSSGQYQPYVAEIPGTMLPPKSTVVIPVTGYCADVHKPPVASGDGMPPIDTWITTTPVPTPKPAGTDYPVVTNVVPPFTPQHIPELVSTPGFLPDPPPINTPLPPSITPTWPGTDRPVDGTIDPEGYPETFAPVIIDALEKITVAFDKLKGEGTVYTPFSGDPEKERESVIQQTFWIFTAEVTGEKYRKESFQEKVIEQFENSTGTPVTTLPEPEKKKLEGGVDAFWNVFVATGVEAKVLSSPNQAQIFPKLEKDELKRKLEEEKPRSAVDDVADAVKRAAEPVREAPGPPMAQAVKTDCLCDSLSYNLVVRRENNENRDRSFPWNLGTKSIKEGNRADSVSVTNHVAGDYFIITFTNLRMACHCQNLERPNGLCDFYARSPIVTNKNKVYLKDTESVDGTLENLNPKEGEADEKNNMFRFKYTPKTIDGTGSKSHLEFCFEVVCESKDCENTNNKVTCGPYCVHVKLKL